MTDETVATRADIIQAYKTISKENQVKRVFFRPNFVDFNRKGITRAVIRREFGTLAGLHFYMEENEEFDRNFATVSEVIQTGGQIKTKPDVRRYVITTAVGDCAANIEFLDSLDSYCKMNRAMVIVMPCESKVNSFDNNTAVFDPEFIKRGYLILNGEMDLNSKIKLLPIQVSANQIKPTTGIARIGDRKSSYVIASPKQFLHYGARSHSGVTPHAIMTPGACTHSNYDTNVFTSKRLSYIANHDHCIGGIIVEIEDDKNFHFRHFQAEEDGSFIDLGHRYYSDGTVKIEPMTLVLGDVHASEVDMNCVKEFMHLPQDQGSKLKTVVLHDLFNGNSISHHIDTIGEMARRHGNNRDNLSEELQMTANFLNVISEYTPDEIVVVKSNHDEWIDRYLREGRYVKDPVNHQYAIRIARFLFEPGDLLENILKDHDSVEIPTNIRFLGRDDSFNVGHVELGAHGDLGANGAKGGLTSIEAIYGRCVVGHAHSAAIQREVFRVGTFTPLVLDYNRGPSSWTQTGAIVYDTGAIQLVNFINGKFCLNG